jgi:2-polyprenyl-3-methyl-5-hydroxy-6-metoxy-1,4-benzoquinol methylase
MDERFYAEYYEVEDRHWWFLGRREVILRMLAAHLPRLAGGPLRLLDVGTGTGALLRHLERFGEVHAVDVEAEAVRFSHLRGATSVRLYDGTTLPYDDASFDVVTAFDVLEHVPDDSVVLAEMLRVLRPGGTLMVMVPAFPFLWGRQDEISHHYRRYLRSGLGEQVRRAGFQLERLSYFNTLLFAPIAVVRLMRRYTGADVVTSDFEMTAEGPVNRLLTRVFAAEARFVARWNLPFGVSLVAVARRPPA